MNARFQELLATGSDFDLWKRVAQAAFDRRWSRGVESLTRLQRLALGTWAASGMIGNRGFFDHTPEEMNEWAVSYEGLGIEVAADAIREAANLMPTIDWNGDDPAEQQLDPIERRYYAANVGTAGVVAALIREQPAEAFENLA
jgi:hypothetical protein